MNYLKEYNRFIYSYYISNGLKITLSIILPALVFWYFSKLELGITIALGTLCVSIIDSPGPYQHRRNSMFIGILVLFFFSLVSQLLAEPYPIQFVFILLASGFLSYISLYGARASNIGLCGLLAIIFSLNTKGGFNLNLIYSLYLGLGGIWYLLFSTLSYRILPLELARKALGECIFKTAQYLSTRSGFYEEEYNETEVNIRSIKEQLEVLESQKVARELLLSNQEILKESNQKGRALVMIFIEIMDIFDELTATHADYSQMHSVFRGSVILSEVKLFIEKFSFELNEFGKEVATNLSILYRERSEEELLATFQKIKDDIADYRKKLNHEDSLLGLLSIRRVERSLERCLDRLHSMQTYHRSKNKIGDIENLDVNSFVDHGNFSLSLFTANLNLNSVYFRHAIRLSLALSIALLILPLWVDHRGYWILLTIVVILKPGFSLSKTRNTERLIGTLIGAGISFLILLWIHSPSILFGLMVIFMFLSYALSNLNYVISVFSTSIFILIYFHFLYPGNLNFVPDRILDTLIGFVISMLCIYTVLPAWEYMGVPGQLIKLIKANITYLKAVNPNSENEKFSLNQYKLARKEVYLCLSNLNSALIRMAKEPIKRRIHAEVFHKLTVLNTQFSTNIAALGAHLVKYPETLISPIFTKVYEDILENFRISILILDSFKFQKSNPSINPKISSERLEDPSKSLIPMDSSDHRNLLQELTLSRFEEIKAGVSNSSAHIHLREFSLESERFEDLRRLANDIRKECITIN